MVEYTALFVMDVLAPGNAVRINPEGYSKPWQAIIQSIIETGKDVYSYAIMFYYLLGGVAIGLLIWPALNGKRKDFKLPGLFAIVMFLILAAHYVPSMYTLQIKGVGRIINLHRYFQMFFYYGCEFYFWGWLKAYINEKKGSPSNRREMSLAEFIICAVACVGTAFTIYYYCGVTSSTINAVWSLKSGEAKTYAEECEARIEALAGDDFDVYVKEYTVLPYLLRDNDSEDCASILSNYYEKNVIFIKNE